MLSGIETKSASLQRRLISTRVEPYPLASPGLDIGRTGRIVTDGKKIRAILDKVGTRHA